MSSHHVKVHAQQFSIEENCPLPPMVYVEDISANGTTLLRQNIDSDGFHLMHLNRKSGSMLLAEGNILQVGADSIFVLKIMHHDIQSVVAGLNPSQKRETEVLNSPYSIRPRLTCISFSNQSIPSPISGLEKEDKGEYTSQSAKALANKLHAKWWIFEPPDLAIWDSIQYV